MKSEMRVMRFQMSADAACKRLYVVIVVKFICQFVDSSFYKDPFERTASASMCVCVCAAVSKSSALAIDLCDTRDKEDLKQCTFNQ